MPANISAMMRDALAEDKFGHEFNSKIDERVAQMNAAQLQGVFNHLSSTARGSKSDMWRNANRQIIGHVEELMKERVGVIQKAAAKRKEADMKDEHREKLKVLRAEQNANALEAVERNARTSAEEEIKTSEDIRRRKERTELVVKMAWLQEARDAHWKKIGAVWLTSSVSVTVILSLNVVASSVGTAAGAIIGIYWGVCSIISGFLAYRKYKHAQLFPKLVTDDDMEDMIEQRAEEIREQALDLMAEQKRKFKLAMAQEKEERRDRKEAARLKKLYEDETEAARLKEQADAAAELVAQLASAKNRGHGAGGSTIASHSVELSREHSPENLAKQTGLDDDGSVGLTIDGDFPGYSEGSEAKNEEIQLMPVLGTENLDDEESSDAEIKRLPRQRFPLDEERMMPLSFTRVDISDLAWESFGVANQLLKGGSFKVNVTAHLASGFADDEDHALRRQNKEYVETFWTSESMGTVGTQTGDSSAQSKVPLKAGGVFKDEKVSLTFPPLQFRATPHHCNVSSASVDHVNYAYTRLGDDQRVVLSVRIFDSRKAKARMDRQRQQQAEEEEDLAEKGLLAPDDAQCDEDFATIGTFEFLLKDILKEWLTKTENSSNFINPSMGTCNCGPLLVLGVLLNSDFAPVGSVKCSLVLGSSCN